MHVCARRLLAGFLTFSSISLLSTVEAQTLRQRPVAKPAPPVQPVKPKAQPAPVLPKGTSLQVEILRHYPMKSGEALEGRLLHPIYWGDELVVPAQTLVRGQVVALEPNRKVRWQGRLRGDFTPYHTPEVRFDELMLPSGPVPLSAPMADDGAPVLHLTAPGVVRKRSFIANRIAQAKEQIRNHIDFFTAPGLGDRALQMLYHQLPYHPERIEAHTAWSFELKAPLTLPIPPDQARTTVLQTAASASGPETWSIQAELTQGVTSAHAKPGDPVDALVVAPVYDKTHQLVVPQGAMLIGKVTTAKPARSLGRNGKLRFAFVQVRMPAGTTRTVEGSLAGASVDKSQNLALDAEGTVTPRNQSSAIAPLLLTMLAGRALDSDGNLQAGTGVASNGFGLVGRIVGLAAGDRNLAAGIGFYAAGLSFYDNFLHSGRDVVFVKDTRIDIQTTPLHSPILKPVGE